MRTSLIRVTYVSTFHASIVEADISELVKRAAQSNKAHDITGVLAVDGDRVCQILEGPAAAVDSLFNSIRTDSRHHTVVQKERREIASSAFTAWGMARQRMADMVVYALAN